MSTSTLILDPGTTGGAQISPDRFPTTIKLTFSPQERAELFYGVNGQRPTIPVKPGQTVDIPITVNSLQLQYRVVSGQAKIAWEL
ncbi:hypothetical protein [uncultured Kordia sp.]|uniref:hypothetical protein n=1 Tax=uncultured Kordia sp. TaxID=507699 RepID=UPI002613090F|nr:hypothetical protein [uncultured Kordia sp.]